MPKVNEYFLLLSGQLSFLEKTILLGSELLSCDASSEHFYCLSKINPRKKMEMFLPEIWMPTPKLNLVFWQDTFQIDIRRSIEGNSFFLRY